MQPSQPGSSSPSNVSAVGEAAKPRPGMKPLRRRLAYAGSAAAALLAVGILGWWSARPTWLWHEATAAAQSERWEQAEEALDRYAWYRPADFVAQRLRSLAAARRGDLPSAVRALEPIPSSPTEAAWAHLTRGRLLKDLFRVREAEREFRSCLAITPAAVEARMNLIIILGVERRGREQQEQLWALHDQGGSPLEALRMLAPAMPVIPSGALSKMTDEGFVLQQCLAADPADPHIRPALAFFHRNRGELERALQLLRPWIEQHPDDGAAIEEYVACLLDSGDLTRVRTWLERLPSSASSRLWQLRAEWLQRDGKNEEAIAALGRAVQAEPNNPEARYRLGQALHAAGRTAQARQELAWHSQAQQLRQLVATIPEAPTEPFPLLAAARLCTGMKRGREARGWYGLVLRLDRNNPEARGALAGPEPAP